MEPNQSNSSPPSVEHIDVFGRSVDRFWDAENRYAGALLKVFDHWVLEVSFRQHTLGSFILFSKHHVERYSQLPEPALVELGHASGVMEQALCGDKVFQPDRFNYLQLGNGLHHLHVHGIPRYLSAREYAGRTWLDEAPGQPPQWSMQDVDRGLVLELRERISRDLVAILRGNG